MCVGKVRKWIKVWCVGWFCVSFLTQLALAQTSEEPFKIPSPEGIEEVRVETAHLTSPGELETEVVPFHIVRSDQVRSGVELELEWLLFPYVMAEVEVPLLRVAPGSQEAVWGVGSPELELKGQVLNSEYVLLALNLGVELPLATSPVLDGVWEVEPSMVLSIPTRWVSTHVVVGTKWEQGEGWEGVLAHAAVHVHPWEDAWSFILATNTRTHSSGVDAVLLPAIEYEYEPWELQLGLAGLWGLPGAREQYGVLGNVEVEF